MTNKLIKKIHLSIFDYFDALEFYYTKQGQLQRWTEHSTLIFENLNRDIKKYF